MSHWTKGEKKKDKLPPVDWDKGIILSEAKLRNAMKESWTGLPLWVKEVDGRKAQWYVFGGSVDDDNWRCINARLLRLLLRDLKGCRIEEILLNGKLEIKWINEGVLPGWAKIGFNFPPKMKDWRKATNIPLKEVTA